MEHNDRKIIEENVAMLEHTGRYTCWLWLLELDERSY